MQKRQTALLHKKAVTVLQVEAVLAIEWAVVKGKVMETAKVIGWALAMGSVKVMETAKGLE